MKDKKNIERTFTLIFSPSLIVIFGYFMDILAKADLKFTLFAVLSLFLAISYRYFSTFLER